MQEKLMIFLTQYCKQILRMGMIDRPDYPVVASGDTWYWYPNLMAVINDPISKMLFKNSLQVTADHTYSYGPIYCCMSKELPTQPLFIVRANLIDIIQLPCSCRCLEYIAYNVLKEYYNKINIYIAYIYPQTILYHQSTMAWTAQLLQCLRKLTSKV